MLYKQKTNLWKIVRIFIALWKQNIPKIIIPKMKTKVQDI